MANGTALTSGKYLPFNMRNVKKLPIVGDVSCERKQWPSTSTEWMNLLQIRPLPIKLNQISYSVNSAERAFNSIRLTFCN